jgi:hypothetical protein
MRCHPTGFEPGSRRRGRFFRAAGPLCGLGLFLFISISFAAERIELEDEDHDGRKETKCFYEGNTIVRAEVDKNNDGKPDQFYTYKNGKLHTAEIDTDFDGKIDVWKYYDTRGKLWRKATDTNKDGKPDVWNEFVEAERELMIQESDRNFDGKIDKRTLKKWNPNKKIQIFSNNRMTSIPNPGYETIWREEDNNFDGIIDVYWNRDKKAASKVGQPMDTALLNTLSADQESPQPSVQKPGGTKEPKKGETQKLVDTMNQRYGLSS